MLRPGDEVDRYVVDRLIGEGGVARVYLVRHRTLGTRFALKTLAISTARVRRRAILEARTQAAISHPCLVSVVDVFEADGLPCLLQEYVDGPSLQRWLERGPPELSAALAMFHGVLAGVEALHARGIVHRDLKPANVLVSIDEHGAVPKVGDFGLVKLLGAPSPAETATGMLLGTPAYGAPEQHENARDVDHRADVFSLGCVLYELVCGRRAFPADNLPALYAAIRDAAYVRPRDASPDLPEPIARAIERLLEPARERRPANVAEVRALLPPPDLGWKHPRHPEELAGCGISSASAAYAALLAHARLPAAESPPASSGAGATVAVTVTAPKPRPSRARAAVVGAGAAIGAGAMVFLGWPDPEVVPPPAPTPVVQATPAPMAASPTLVPAPSPRAEAPLPSRVAPAAIPVVPAPPAPSEADPVAEATEPVPIVAPPPPPDLALIGTGRTAEAVAASLGAAEPGWEVVRESVPARVAVAVGAAAATQVPEGTPFVAVGVDAAPGAAAVASSRPDPVALVAALRTLIPDLRTIGGLHGGGGAWWSALAAAGREAGVTLETRVADPPRLRSQVSSLMARTQVILLAPDEIWTPEALASVFTDAQSARAAPFPVVGFARSHLSAPRGPPLVALGRSGAEVGAAVELARRIAGGQAPGGVVWAPLELHAVSRLALLETAGVRLDRTSERVVSSFAD